MGKQDDATDVRWPSNWATFSFELKRETELLSAQASSGGQEQEEEEEEAEEEEEEEEEEDEEEEEEEEEEEQEEAEEPEEQNRTLSTNLDACIQQPAVMNKELRWLVV